MSAGGQIGHSQVYSKWKGIPYARRYVIPANPNSEGQQLTRGTFRAADQQWKYMGSLARAPFIAAAKGRPLVPRNMLMKTEIPIVRDETDISKWVFSPGNGGGIAPESVEVAAGSDNTEINVTVTAPTAPVDWTLEGITAVAIKSRAPDDLPDTMDLEASGTESGTAITLTGAEASTEYVVGGFLKWKRSDGTTVYGHSITKTFTTAAS